MFPRIPRLLLSVLALSIWSPIAARAAVCETVEHLTAAEAVRAKLEKSLEPLLQATGAAADTVKDIKAALQVALAKQTKLVADCAEQLSKLIPKDPEVFKPDIKFMVRKAIFGDLGNGHICNATSLFATQIENCNKDPAKRRQIGSVHYCTVTLNRSSEGSPCGQSYDPSPDAPRESKQFEIELTCNKKVKSGVTSRSSLIRVPWIPMDLVLSCSDDCDPGAQTPAYVIR